ncbi:type II toxin-antitoxin system RelE/ParE family toxin [Cellulomonas triticagri]|uniref:type II toxin-antitoxin system RelE/ParE family toxin n=1 Tax=Cellulomonas triticagri TaxID=2483352 RepID=UPI00272EA79A|nr:type II toxin-antitoxin system RelE/ParE family toxin [Cellulomonas triticagri]
MWRRQHTPRLGVAEHRAAHKKLLQLAWAEGLSDLRVPPGNRLEKLAGDRVGQHSIRVNDQYRICFTWTPSGPADVEITDYH